MFVTAGAGAYKCCILWLLDAPRQWALLPCWLGSQWKMEPANTRLPAGRLGVTACCCRQSPPNLLLPQWSCALVHSGYLAGWAVVGATLARRLQAAVGAHLLPVIVHAGSGISLLDLTHDPAGGLVVCRRADRPGGCAAFVIGAGGLVFCSSNEAPLPCWPSSFTDGLLFDVV